MNEISADKFSVSLNRDELIRYSRQILLPDFGRSGQEQLKSSRITVLGAGGLGSPVLIYLAAAGLGHIRFLEDDNLDLTNLQRQTLYGTRDIGTPKVYAAARRLRELNPEIELQALRDTLLPENALRLLADSDLILDTTDSFAAKFLANDAAFFLKTSILIGGILRYEGQIFAAEPGKTACYRCLFREPPKAKAVPRCSEAGVLGALAGTLGSIQATQAIRILLGIGEDPRGRILRINSLNDEIRSVPLPRNPHCPLCGENPTILSIKAENYPDDRVCQ